MTWALMPRTNHPRTCPSNPGRTSAAAAAPAASRAGTGCNGVGRRAGSSISCVHTVGISAAEPPGHRMKEVAGMQLYPYSLKVLERASCRERGESRVGGVGLEKNEKDDKSEH